LTESAESLPVEPLCLAGERKLEINEKNLCNIAVGVQHSKAKSKNHVFSRNLALFISFSDAFKRPLITLEAVNKKNRQRNLEYKVL
jgi:hypothetical protein